MEKNVADVLEDARTYKRFRQMTKYPAHFQWIDHRLTEVEQRLTEKLGKDGFNALVVCVYAESDEEVLGNMIGSCLQS